MEKNRKQDFQEKTSLSTQLNQKIRQLEDELRLQQSRNQIQNEELKRIREELMSKDKKINELTPLASQASSQKTRIEHLLKDVESLR